MYVRQGDPGTEEFIASMIESPVQRELGLSVGLLVWRDGLACAGCDATQWLGAAGLGLPGFSSFIKKEAAEVLQDGGLS